MKRYRVTYTVDVYEERPSDAILAAQLILHEVMPKQADAPHMEAFDASFDDEDGTATMVGTSRWMCLTAVKLHD